MIAVSEIFGPTIQGEGALIGVPTVFVRTGGCDFRCSWCDTRYAVEPAFKADWRSMAAEAILAEVNRLSGGEPILVTLSGGNPALQPLELLIKLGHRQGHRFAMETQGSQAQPWFAALDHLTLSPKPPSSGMPFRKERFDACLAAAGTETQLSLKLVIADEADYQWAKPWPPTTRDCRCSCSRATQPRPRPRTPSGKPTPRPSTPGCAGWWSASPRTAGTGPGCCRNCMC